MKLPYLIVNKCLFVEADGLFIVTKKSAIRHRHQVYRQTHTKIGRVSARAYLQQMPRRSGSEVLRSPVAMACLEKSMAISKNTINGDFEEHRQWHV